MLAVDISRRVREIAGDISVLQFAETTLVDWINDGIRECVIDNSLLQAKATSNTVIGTGTYVLPADIFKLHSIWVDEDKLQVMTLQEWEDFTGGKLPPAGTPVMAYVYAGQITLSPVPTAVAPMVINYSKTPAAIVYNPVGPTYTPNTPAIPEAFHNRLVTYCLAQVALQDENQEKYMSLMLEFSTGIRNLDHTKNEDDLYPFISVSARDCDWYE